MIGARASTKNGADGIFESGVGREDIIKLGARAMGDKKDYDSLQLFMKKAHLGVREAVAFDYLFDEEDGKGKLPRNFGYFESSWRWKQHLRSLRLKYVSGNIFIKHKNKKSM
jgi:hypothetical protein